MDETKEQIKTEQNKEYKAEIKKSEPKKSIKQTLFEIYDKKYKVLLLIPFIVLVLAIGQIIYQYNTTGDFLIKDVSLKGGVTITIPYGNEFDAQSLENSLSKSFSQNDINVRLLRGAGVTTGAIIEADIDGSNRQQLDFLVSEIGKSLNIEMSKTNYGIEVVGSSLGTSFFMESLIALAVAFIFMGLVVLIYFRSYIPSLAIILATFSDMVISLAVVNLLGIKIGTAGIAAFLMLIGYGVDTNILLTVRVLKRKEGSVMDRVMGSLKTGMTMTFVAMLSVTVVLFMAQSDVIRQIMIITLVGLFADILFTWVQNVGLLRIYLERKSKKGVSV